MMVRNDINPFLSIYFLGESTFTFRGIRIDFKCSYNFHINF